jgi:phospholipase C
MNTYWRKGCAALALTAIMQPGLVIAEEGTSVATGKSIVIAPRSSDEVAKHTISVEAKLTQAEKLALLKKKVKYVFVLFQENRSFDFYFGTYPGANGLFSKPAAKTAGFVQPIVNIDGSTTTISPFKIPTSVLAPGNVTVPIYPADTASVDHSHAGIDNDLDVDTDNTPHNDRYALNAEGLTTKDGQIVSLSTGLPATTPPTLAQKQTAELVLGHVDCDTAPVLWNYADRFTLFDNFFDTVIGPSTPNALGMFSGQSGLTQWVEHPELSSLYTTTNAALPIVSDPQPFWGSALDVFTPPSEKQPVDNPGGVSSNPASNLTYASLGLSFMGSKIYDTTSYDSNVGADLADVQNDIEKIAGDKNKPVNWAWYQEGYDHEPTDPTGTITNYDYIAHHNAPQYFGYEANNPVETKAHLKGLGDFFTAVSGNALPSTGGVFYVRGGYGNLDGLTPQDKNPAVQADFAGNDDHPGYSDLQISSALIADEVNAIASSPYWKDSAIIITYDETDGEYDHTLPIVRSQDPEGNPLDQGPRIPAIVVSPYSVVHAVSKERTEHNSIIKFIDELFNLTPLADLPDEAAARKLGEKEFGQKYMGPADAGVPNVGDMLSAFDNNRLMGKEAPLEASYAMIPTAQTLSFPQFGGEGCRILGITPTDTGLDGTVIDPAPADFNPRPSVTPGIPTSGTWTP